MSQAVDLFRQAAHRAVLDPPTGSDPWLVQYHADLRFERGMATYLRATEQMLALIGGVETIRDRVVLDAGSGFGMVANLMASWGARHVIALELFPPMADTHRRILARDFRHLDGRILQIRGDASHMAVRDRSVDVVLSFEAISHYYDVPGFLDECARVLKPGGRLLVSDGNNGANPGLRAFTRRLWVRYEVGPAGRYGDREVGDSMQSRRERIIAGAFPSLPPDRVHTLAANTSGMERTEIVEKVRRHLDGGPAPDTPYHEGTLPRDPDHGYVLEALFDPPRLAADVARRGFEAHAVPHYGGAHNDLYLAANRVLRRLPTFRYARAFRIVARRKPSAV